MEKFIELGQDMAQLWAAHWDRYLAGIGNTLALAVVATVIGCVIGLLCGILNTIPYTKRDPIIKRFFLKLIRVVVRIYVEVFRGTPMVLQAVFIYYGLPFFTNEQVMFRGNGGLWLAAIIVVSINTGAYMAETVRGGILSIDPGQTEGAKAIGMTHVQTMTSVILPQAFRNIVGNNYMYFQSAAIEMLGYLTMTLVFSFVLRRVERLLAGPSSYKLAAALPRAMAAGTYRHPKKGHAPEDRNREYRERLKKEERERLRQAPKQGQNRGGR